MVHVSEKRSVIPWTKRTSYANIAASRRPSEVAQGTMANIKNEDRDLNIWNNKMSRVHRKSLCQMDAQRKELEKSMLEYTDKVREIRDSKTNSLFREIHTRQSRHSLSDTRSLTNSIDSQDIGTLPVDSAKIRKRQKRLQMSNTSRFPPILENKSSRQAPVIRPLSADRHVSDYKMNNRMERRRRRHRMSCKKYHDDTNDDDTDSDQTEARNVDIEQFKCIMLSNKQKTSDKTSKNKDSACQENNKERLANVNEGVEKQRNHNTGMENLPVRNERIEILKNRNKDIERLKVNDKFDSEDSGISSADGLSDLETDHGGSVRIDSVRKREEDVFTLPKIHKRKPKLPLIEISNHD